MGFRARLIAVFLVICLFLGMGYVGFSGMTITSKEEVNTLFHKVSEKETIYFWYSDETLTDFISSAAVTYGAAHNCRVIPTLVSDSDYLENIYEASVRGTQVPDVYLLNNDALEKAYLAGLASEIRDGTNLVTTQSYPQASLDAVTYKNKYVAYPYYYETSAFLYNKTYLEAWTAEQIAAAEAAAAEGEEGEEEDIEDIEDTGEDDETEIIGEENLEVTREQIEAGIPSTISEVLAFADNYDAPENVEAIFSWDVSDVYFNYCFVGNYLNVGGPHGDDAEIINIDNPEARTCLEVFQNLNQFFSIESDTITYESVIRDFMEGKIVFTIAKPEVLNLLDQAIEEGTFAYEYGVCRIPSATSTLSESSISITACIAVNGYSQHSALANDFAAYLTGEAYGNLYERTGKLSTNRYANVGDPNLAAFFDEYKHSSSLPKLIEATNYWIEAEVMMERVWDGGNIGELLTEFQKQMESQLSHAQQNVQVGRKDGEETDTTGEGENAGEENGTETGEEVTDSSEENPDTGNAESQTTE